jgi:hypothetical protein
MSGADFLVISSVSPGLCLTDSKPRTGRDENGIRVLEYEIRQEQAATIGRLAQDLRDALDALEMLDRRASSGTMAGDSPGLQRARLVDAAAYALWNFVVQRECSGFRWTEEVLKDYTVPLEVRAKMGALRPRQQT